MLRQKAKERKSVRAKEKMMAQQRLRDQRNRTRAPLRIASPAGVSRPSRGTRRPGRAPPCPGAHSLVWCRIQPHPGDPLQGSAGNSASKLRDRLWDGRQPGF